MADRKMIQDLFIRISKDSGWSLDYTRVAKLAAQILGIHPLEVANAFADLGLMERIAQGEHPVCHPTPSNKDS